MERLLGEHRRAARLLEVAPLVLFVEHFFLRSPVAALLLFADFETFPGEGRLLADDELLDLEDQVLVGRQSVLALLAEVLAAHLDARGLVPEEHGAARLIHLLPAMPAAARELLADVLRSDLELLRGFDEIRREIHGPVHDGSIAHVLRTRDFLYNPRMTPLASSGNELTIDRPFTFLLFGASGHLAQLKIYPSLYVLALKKRLPKEYAIVGFARTDMSQAEFRALVGDAIKKDMGEVNEKTLKDFLGHVHYHEGQYDDAKSFKALATTLGGIEGRGWTRVAYLSVPPEVFPAILENLGASKIHKKGHKGDFRVIIEKPVGHDLKSFQQLRKLLLSRFAEQEIYLLDHYLGKEAVRNIYYLRYANPVLERLLKNTLIDRVEVVADESRGIEGRAGYFESTGMLRDWVQSHLLMIASLLTMRLHETGESAHAARLNALEQFYLPPAGDMNDVVVQGQYGAGMAGKEKAVAYVKEKGVATGSRTSTFVALQLRTRMSRWEGVPFYFRCGKRLAKKETRVSIWFQEPRTVGKGATPNRIDIILLGEAGMRLHLQTKLGGSLPQFRPLIMEDPLVCIGDCLPEHALLLLETIHGNHQWFLTFEEVKTAWTLIDPIQHHLDQKKTPLHTYAAGSDGPEEARRFS